MPYNENFADRIRNLLEDHPEFAEKKMFGGLSFLIHGNMCCGVMEDRIMVRVGPDRYEEALKRKHAAEMDFTGKPLKGMVYVLPEGFKTRKQLQSWLNWGVEFAKSLPKK